MPDGRTRIPTKWTRRWPTRWSDSATVDILVNNAAGNFVVPAEDLSVNGWNAVVNIVLNGTFYCTRAFGKHWIDSGHPGTILNVIATYAWTGGPGHRSLRRGQGGRAGHDPHAGRRMGAAQIRVNAIAPGPIDKTGGAQALWPTEAAEEKVRASVPLGRLGEPEEIAHAAAYLSPTTPASLTANASSSTAALGWAAIFSPNSRDGPEAACGRRPARDGPGHGVGGWGQRHGVLRPGVQLPGVLRSGVLRPRSMNLRTRTSVKVALS